MKKNIALLAGGYTGEYAISIQTASTIQKNIDSSQYAIYTIIVSKGKWVYREGDQEIPCDLNDFSLTLTTGKIVFDAAFIAIHGTPGEDGKVQGYLEMKNIPFTTCDSVVSGLTFNKIFCNRVVEQSGLVHVSKSIHVIRGRHWTEDTILNQIQLPVFVKPAEGGSSLATTKVKSREELKPAIDAVFEFGDQAMVEEFVKGREFSIGVFRSKGQVTALPITEIISSKEFFDYEAKYTPGVSREVTPAEVSNEQKSLIQEKAIRIYELLNCKGVCRIDFILEEETGHLYFLEINTVPGQSENSIVPQQARIAGYSLMQFYGMLLEEAMENATSTQ